MQNKEEKNNPNVKPEKQLQWIESQIMTKLCMADFEKIRELGIGGYGRVILAKKRKTD